MFKPRHNEITEKDKAIRAEDCDSQTSKKEMKLDENNRKDC